MTYLRTVVVIAVLGGAAALAVHLLRDHPNSEGSRQPTPKPPTAEIGTQGRRHAPENTSSPGPVCNVLTPSGDPIEGALISFEERASRDRKTPTVTSDAHGRARLSGRGDRVLGVSASGRATWWSASGLVADQDVTIVLAYGQHVRGTVVHAPSGRPAAGVEVRFGAAPGIRATTDAAGRFVLAGLSVGVNELRFRSPDVIGVVTVALQVPQDGDVLFRIPDIVTLRGAVHAEGRAVANAGVRVIEGDAPAAAPSALSDAEGRFSVSAFEFHNVLLEIDHPDYVPKRVHWAGNNGIEHEESVELDVGGSLSVVQEAGDVALPTTGRVQLLGERFSVNRALDADGCVFRRVPAGRYRVLARAGGFRAEADASVTVGRTDTVELAFSKARGIQGRVHWADGSPAVDAQVVAVMPNLPAVGTVDERGAFRIDAVDAASVEALSVVAPSGYTVTLDPAQFGGHEIDVVLPVRDKSVRVRVLGESIGEVHVAASRAIDESSHRRASDDLVRVFPGPGEYEVGPFVGVGGVTFVAWTSSAESERVRIDLTGDSSASVDLQLRQMPSVSGTVVRADSDEPVSFATIERVSAGGERILLDTADEWGRFSALLPVDRESRIRVSATGFGAVEKIANRSPTDPLRIRLPPVAKLSRTIDATSWPELDSVEVTVSRVRPLFVRRWRGSAGAFSISDVPLGDVRLTVDVILATGERALAWDAREHHDAQGRASPITLPPPEVWNGVVRVRGAGGLSGAVVTATSDLGPHWWTRSDEDGTFRLFLLSGQDYRIECTADGFATWTGRRRDGESILIVELSPSQD